MASLTRDAVARVLGPVDDHLMADILSTQASESELRAARHWLANDDAVLREVRAFPDTRVGRLIEILETASVVPEDDPAG